ncbi:MAG: transposase [Sandaracinaceae bacterium]|nr:transposase [Sandaracinaceae bacterium]
MHDRRFLLRPDDKLTVLVTWLLATLAPLFDVEVHAMSVMSTHYHLVCSVGDQRISDFLRDFNASLAKAVNVLRGARRGIVWEPGTLSIVELKTVDAIITSIAYAIVNPVAAGLVWRPEDWPGLNVLAHEIGRRVREVAAPDYFFRTGFWDPTAVLVTTLPARLLEELGEDEARRRIEAEVERQLREARAHVKSQGWQVLGPVAARNVSPFRRAKSWEDFGALSPTFAVGAGNHEERRAAIAELKAFRAAYRAAWIGYRAGERDAVWPYGTYLMRVRHRVEVEPAPS